MAKENDDSYLLYFSDVEYRIIQKSLRYYIQELPFNRRPDLRAKVSPLLMGNHNFNMDENLAKQILKAIQKSKNIIKHKKVTNKVKNKLIKYMRLCRAMSESPKKVQKEFKYDYQLFTHGQTKKALERLFKGLVINSKDDNYYCQSLLSGIAVHATSTINKTAKRKFFLLKTLVVEARGLVTSSQGNPKLQQDLKKRYKMLKDVQKKGYKFVIGMQKNNTYVLDKVKRSDVQLIFDKMKTLVQKLVEGK